MPNIAPVSSSSSSSSDSSFSYEPPPLTDAQRRVYAQLDPYRHASNIALVAAVVMLAVTVVFIGLAQGRYLLPLVPLYPFSACIGLVLVSAAIHCYFRSLARKHHMTDADIAAYTRIRQPLPPKEPEKKPSKK